MVYILGLALMVVGAVELIRLAVFRLQRGSPRGGRLVLVVLPEGEEDCEALVRAAAQRVNWMDLKPPCKLVCVEAAETQEVLGRLRWDMPGLEVCEAKELGQVLMKAD